MTYESFLVETLQLRNIGVYSYSLQCEALSWLLWPARRMAVCQKSTLYDCNGRHSCVCQTRLDMTAMVDIPAVSKTHYTQSKETRTILNLDLKLIGLTDKLEALLT